MKEDEQKKIIDGCLCLCFWCLLVPNSRRARALFSLMIMYNILRAQKKGNRKTLLTIGQQAILSLLKI